MEIREHSLIMLRTNYGEPDDYPIYDLDINENNTVNIYMMERKTH